jgi:hypothetical protein
MPALERLDAKINGGSSIGLSLWLRSDDDQILQ